MRTRGGGKQGVYETKKKKFTYETVMRGHSCPVRSWSREEATDAQSVNDMSNTKFNVSE